MIQKRVKALKNEIQIYFHLINDRIILRMNA